MTFNRHNELLAMMNITIFYYSFDAIVDKAEVFKAKRKTSNTLIVLGFNVFFVCVNTAKYKLKLYLNITSLPLNFYYYLFLNYYSQFISN